MSKEPERGEGPAERLLRVADRMFYRQGYGATGINALIAEAGVAKASFYQHYAGKEALILAYLRSRHAGWMAGLEAAVAAQDEPRRRVVAIFDWLDAWLRENDFRGCAFLNTIPEYSDPESAPRRLVREHKAELHQRVERLCAEADQPEAADAVFLLVEGAMTQAAVRGDSWPADAARALVEQRLGL